MLKKFLNVSKNTRRAIYKASAWLAIFQLVAILPLFMIYSSLLKMFEAYSQGGKIDISLVLCIILGTVIVLVLYFAYRKMYKMKYINAAAENLSMRMDVADKLRRLPESFLSKHDLSDLTSTIMDDIGVIEGALANQVTEFLGSLLGILVAVCALFFVNVKMALALFSVLPVAAIAMALCDPISGKTHLKNRNAKLAISEQIQEYLENIKVLKSSGNIKDYQKRLSGKMKRLVPRLVLFEFLAGMSISTAYNLLRLGIGIVAITGANLLIKGEITASVYIIFMLASVWIYEPLSYTCEYLGAVIASKVAANRIRNIMDYPEQEGKEKLAPQGYDIDFKNVGFSYKEGGDKVLSEVSFTAKQGEYTALVGASGSGKSTICRLAAQLWDNDSGEILVGGQNVKTVPPEELFKLYSIVFQDVTLFNDTIYNNILIGNKKASREQVLAAAEYAQCMPFIEKLPEGIDTVLGENGHTLSGGERQRLSIARAFLKDAPIVLLDESTASIDPETETKIQSAIEKLTKDRTVLMIAHRLRSIVNCDRIIVLEQGRVVGNGSHEELMESCPVYKKLYTLQSE
ncbi:MAG: ABC transporter ATP-binding protein/permease [Treponemataceae bacterium]|nr:ABC transporter ATP-binding protein/permease [Treponemataceae bacterium]